MSYDKKITLRKGIEEMLVAGISAILTTGVNYFNQISPEESAGLFLVLIGVLEAGRNWWKQKGKEKFKELI